MDFGLLINALPYWLLFVITAGISIGGVEAGAYAARASLRRQATEPEGPLGTLVGSLLGLLAFILAFTFGMTSSRFETRKQLVLEESNALGTAYLRAGLLPSSQKREIRRLVKEYVEVRLNGTVQTIPQVLQRSNEIHDLLWAQAESLVKADLDSELRALFIDSLNSVIDLHESRVTVALRNRIPGPIWLALYALTILSMVSIGYQVGMTGSSRLRSMPLMALGFSLVIVMIAAMDNPDAGIFHASSEPLKDVMQLIQRQPAN